MATFPPDRPEEAGIQQVRLIGDSAREVFWSGAPRPGGARTRRAFCGRFPAVNRMVERMLGRHATDRPPGNKE